MSNNHSHHFDHLLDLLQLEREAEKEENKRELDRYPLHVRETLGKTVTRLEIVEEDVGVGGIPLLRLTRRGAGASTPSRGSGELSPFHSMNQGDNVRLTYPPSADLDPVDGTLYDVGDLTVTVALNGAVPEPLPAGLCQLDMLGSDATYKRMRQALGQVKRTEKSDLTRLRDIVLGERPAGFDIPEPLKIANTSLNEFQVEAVIKAMAAQDMAVIHGPPGTGKTTVLVEIILQSVRKGLRVLASAPSNIAVDNMVEKLLPYNLRIVRMGHPARILEPLRHVTLTAQEEETPLRDEIKRLENERHRLLVQMRRKDSRGAGLDFAEKRQLYAEADRLGKEARDMEFSIRRQILQNAQVVLATHAGTTGQLTRHKFDLVVMDEASQATEPLSWIPITFGKRVIFAGDSCQLPPTIYSKEAAKQGLALTLFDQLQKRLPEEGQSLLRIQYRMHEDIMRFSSDKFYDGQLIAHESVAKHLAQELEGVKSSDLTRVPVVYIDTAGTGYGEEWNELLESRENTGEAGLVMKIYAQLLADGLQPWDVAMISPYVAQVRKLRSLCPDRDVEIGSVDGFQGREKDVVIVSLVRSNEKGEVGFLSDTRRMNVAMTRARRLLIVLGDSATISRHAFYRDFLAYVEKREAHRSAWEWIQ